MLNEKFLLDNFHAEGNDFEGLKEIIQELKEVTKFKRCSSKDLALLSYLGYSKDLDKMYFFRNDPETIEFIKDYILEQLTLCGVSFEDIDFEESKQRFAESKKRMINSIRKQDILKKGDFEGLIDEVKNNKLMIFDGDNLTFTSEHFLATAERFGLKGHFLTRPTINRDNAIERQLSDEFPCTLVVKEINGIHKAFSLLSGKYKPIDQEVLFRVINALSKDESLGEPVCKKWEVTNFMTSVYIEFPKKADEIQSFYKFPEKLIPGLWLATSDTGHCSLKVRGTWRKGSATTFEKEILKKHMGEIDISKIVKEVEETIFAEYNKLPERLCELMLCEVTDPDWDLSTEEGRYKNSERIKETVKSVFDQVDMLKVLGLKRKKMLMNQYLDEFDPEMRYTAYDIAIGIMEFPNRVEVPNKDDFMKACGSAPYANYEIEEETIALL